MTKEYLALTTNWWVKLRDREPIRFALAKAARKHWLPALERRMDEHKQHGQGCSSWTQLAKLLEVNSVTLFRWRAAKKAEDSPSLDLQKIESLAGMLDIPVAQLVPEPWCQLAWTVEGLCRGSVTSAEAQAYSLFCQAVPVCHWEGGGSGNGDLHRSAVKAVVDADVYQSEKEAEQAIRKVAQQLEPMLVRVLQETA